jgi:hypothetical protein
VRFAVAVLWYEITEWILTLIGIAIAVLAIIYGEWVLLLVLLLIIKATLGPKVHRWWFMPLWPLEALSNLITYLLGRARLLSTVEPRIFPDSLRHQIEQSTSIVLHRVCLSFSEGDEYVDSFRSLGSIQVDSPRARRRIIRSMIQGNRECYFWTRCLDCDYGVRFVSATGVVDLITGFNFGNVFVRGSDHRGSFDMGGRPECFLDWLLQTNGVPRPRRRRENAAEPTPDQSPAADTAK